MAQPDNVTLERRQHSRPETRGGRHLGSVFLDSLTSVYGVYVLGSRIAAFLVLLLVVAPALPASAAAGVMTFDGSYFFRHTDLVLDAGTTTIAFERGYDSADPRSTDLGPYWTHSFAMRVVRTGVPGQFAVVGPVGRRDL